VLVPYLRAFQSNRISIDPKNLAVDADVPATKAVVVPADRSAALLKFGVSLDAESAVVMLKSSDGRAIPVGSNARLRDADQDATVGYDGEVYLRGLHPSNILTVERAEQASCEASFDYHPTPGERVVIKDVVCK
jgi:outer membrane usher protein